MNKYKNGDRLYMLGSNKDAMEVEIVEYRNGFVFIKHLDRTGGMLIRESKLFRTKEEALSRRMSPDGYLIIPEFKTQSGRRITYHGIEKSHEIKRKVNSKNTITSLNSLFEILLNCWERETAYPSAQKDPNYNFAIDPTYGQCAITAMLVNDMFGGTIHKINVEGGGTHYFNHICDSYFDLTSDQFTLYNIPIKYDDNRAVDRAYCGQNESTRCRYNRLKQNIVNHLKEGK